LSRCQLAIFCSLLAISITFFCLGERADVSLSNSLSSILLLPIEVISKYINFFTTTSYHIEELEILTNKLRLENAELRDRLNNDSIDYPCERFKLLKAQVIGRDPLNINGYLYIDKGSGHKLFKDQPVVSIDGLVGKIRYVGKRISIAETIENSGFAVSAVASRSGVHGIVRKKEQLIFDYVKSADDVRIGDSIFTSGMSKIFPKGIFIGTVNNISQSSNLYFKDVSLESSVKVNRLSKLYVILYEILSREGGPIEKFDLKQDLRRLNLVVPKFER